MDENDKAQKDTDDCFHPKYIRPFLAKWFSSRVLQCSAVYAIGFNSSLWQLECTLYLNDELGSQNEYVRVHILQLQLCDKIIESYLISSSG